MDFQNILPVEHLGSGTWAEVAHVSGEAGWVARLAELGLRIGSRLQVLQPGRPCLLAVAGSRLTVRADLAQILVRPEAPK